MESINIIGILILKSLYFAKTMLDISSASVFVIWNSILILLFILLNLI
ncbi:hypothetical protein [Leptospira mtsangambouensis]|nr:hypothetical protein [Leptospira mtsangambouensis]